MKKKYIIIELIILCLVICVDMLTKSLFDGKEIEIWNNVFVFSSAHNQGAAFSLFNGKVDMLIIVTILFLTAFIAFHIVTRKSINTLGSVAFSLIVAGALGNFIDRIMLGYVRDFIYVELIKFPVFNIADSCLTIGVILFAINILFVIKPLKTEAKQIEK